MTAEARRRPMVAGNWKMHGDAARNAALLDGLLAAPALGADVEVLVCPPLCYLQSVAARLAGSAIALGAQDVAAVQGEGAHTGEVSASMLADVGCRYVLVGHSERRALYGDSDEVVAKKFFAAQAAGLVPVLCVGESLDEREAGQTEAVLDRQLDAVLATAGIAAMARALVAYEPVWAIGTGRTATPEIAQAAHAHLRSRLAEHDATIAGSVRILYGGSVKPANAATLFAQPDVDGGLIGGASLDAADFRAICEAAV